MEKAQHLRMLAEDLGSVLSIYTAIHNLLQMLSQGIQYPLLASVGSSMQTMHINSLRQIHIVCKLSK